MTLLRATTSKITVALIAVYGTARLIRVLVQPLRSGSRLSRKRILRIIFGESSVETTLLPQSVRVYLAAVVAEVLECEFALASL